MLKYNKLYVWCIPQRDKRMILLNTGGGAPMAELKERVAVTEEEIGRYLAHLRAMGRPEGTIQTYRLGLDRLYHSLPEDKEVGPNTLHWWQGALLEAGYSPSTVNTWLSVAASFLDYLDYPLYRAPRQLAPDRGAQPELSRTEYLRLLQTARLLEKEREYLYIKVFAQVGLSVQELNRLTVEAAQAGFIQPEPGEEEALRLPAGLREELLDYSRRRGVRTGPVFVTRTGRAVKRTNVSDSVRRLCREAQVAPEKGNPRCLRKLYLETRASIQDSLRLLAEQTYDQMLAAEQAMVGWGLNKGGSHAP